MLRLSAHDTRPISLLLVAEVAINGALEDIEKSIACKKDLKTKAFLQGFKLKLEKALIPLEGVGDVMLEGQKPEFVKHCIDKANSLAQIIDNNQGRK